MKFDLHNHLGKNGANPGFDETIDLVYKKLGENSVFGITNRNCDFNDNRFEIFVNQKGKYEREWIDDGKRILFVPEKNIYVVGTEEILTKQGHLVVIGIPSYENIQKDGKTLSLEDALKSANDLNGIKIAVHPCGRDGLVDYISNNLDLLNNFDGWEIYNASAELAVPGILPFDANKKSIEFYYSKIKNNYDVGACAFTDGHSVKVIGKSYTNLNLKNISVNSLGDAIRANRDSNNLHMKPAKWDAFKHAINIVKHRLFNTEA